MPAYDYEVIDANGQSSKGQVEADSADDVVRRLAANGQTVVDVSESRQRTAGLRRRRLRGSDVVVAFHELATLLESGVSLSDAVLAQSRGTHHPSLVAAFETIAKNLMRGERFLAAVGDSGLPLPDYVYQLVEAGEMSGRLPQALRQAVDQMQYDQRVAADIRGALTYPAILVVAGVTAVLLVFIFVVPQFSNLLEDAANLPLLAEFVLRTGVWFNANTWLLAGTVIAVASIGTMLLRRDAVRQRLMDAIGAVPILRDWFSEVDTAKWASVMGAMLASRVELMDALGLASRGVRMSRRKVLLERAVNEVRGGAALSEALEKQDALTPTGYNLIRVGERSGQLAEMMRALAALYEENGTRRMKRVLTFIEPLAVLTIGAVLGTIMIGLILAITSVNEIVL